MTAEETKRRIRKVHDDMNEAIANSGTLAVLARSVQDVNETLSIHAAWTEERFDKVDERFDRLEATMSREFHLLNLRLDQVISFATKSELGGGISGETSQ